MAGLPLLLLDRISPLICPLGVIQLSRQCRLADSTTDVDDDRAQVSHRAITHTMLALCATAWLDAASRESGRVAEMRKTPTERFVGYREGNPMSEHTCVNIAIGVLPFQVG